MTGGRDTGEPRPGAGGSGSGPSPLLRVEGLTRHFGALAALNDVSLQVAARERRAVIGPNGAGKTTLFNLIAGELAPTRGRIVFAGEPTGRLSPDAVARHGIARSYQRNNGFPSLPVLENLRLAAAAREPGRYDLLGSVSRRRAPIDRARAVADAVGLAARLGEPAGRLSYGEQRQLEIGIALATRPRLLLLDEPTAGMSPDETHRMIQLLQALPAETTVLVIEHDMDVVFTLAERITVLHHGEVLCEGTPDEVRTDPRVYDVYLGGHA